MSTAPVKNTDLMSGRDKKLATDRLSAQPLSNNKIAGAIKDGSNRNYKD